MLPIRLPGHGLETSIDDLIVQDGSSNVDNIDDYIVDVIGQEIIIVRVGTIPEWHAHNRGAVIYRTTYRTTEISNWLSIPRLQDWVHMSTEQVGYVEDLEDYRDNLAHDMRVWRRMI